MKRILLMILLATLIACSNNVTNNDDSAEGIHEAKQSEAIIKNDASHQLSAIPTDPLVYQKLKKVTIDEEIVGEIYINGSYSFEKIGESQTLAHEKFDLFHNKNSNFNDIIIPIKIDKEDSNKVPKGERHILIKVINKDAGTIIMTRSIIRENYSASTYNLILPNNLNTQDLNLELDLQSSFLYSDVIPYHSKQVIYSIHIQHTENPLLDNNLFNRRVSINGINMGINYYQNVDNITKGISLSIYANGITPDYNSNQNELFFDIESYNGDDLYSATSKRMNGVTFSVQPSVFDNFGHYYVNFELNGWQGKAVYRKEFSIFKPSTLPQNLTSEFYNNPPKLDFNVSSSENENITFKVTRYTHKNAFDPIPIASKTYYVNNKTEFTDNDFVNHYTNQPGLSSLYACVFSIIEPSQFVNYLEYKIEVRLDGDKIEEHTVYYQYELYPENQGPGGPGGRIPN